jgi:ATP-dependent Clp protease ATP-binding subunit ClpA
VFTGNIGSKLIEKKLMESGGFEINPNTRSFRRLETNIDTLANQALKASGYFRPETLNRLDAVVACHPLTRAHIEEITDLKIAKLNRLLGSHESQIQISLTPEAKKYLVDKGSDFAMGARPINRFVNNTIVTKLSELELAGKLKPGQTIEITEEQLAQWTTDSIQS